MRILTMMLGTLAVAEVHALLVQHFPAVAGAPNPNELPDAVVLL